MLFRALHGSIFIFIAILFCALGGINSIRRGLCRLHHHKEMPPQRFERYRRRYSPYGSTASLYLWALAGDETLCV